MLFSAALLFPFCIVADENENTAPKPEIPWFQIEVIIFEQSEPNRFIEENWDEHPPLPDLTQAIDFLTPEPVSENADDSPLNSLETDKTVVLEDKFASVPEKSSPLQPSHSETSNGQQLTTNIDSTLFEQSGMEQLQAGQNIVIQFEKPFVAIDREDLLLLRELEILQKNKHLRILSAVGWRQAVNGNKDAETVRILGGEDFISEYDQNGDAISTETTIIDPNKSINAEGNIDTSQFNQTTIPDHFQRSADEAPQHNPLNDEIINSESSESVTPDSAISTDNPDCQPIEAVNHEEKTDGSSISSNNLSEMDSTHNVHQQNPSSVKLLSACQSMKVAHLWELDGTVKVHVKKYLHINFDLIYRHTQQKLLEQPSSPPTELETETETETETNTALTELPLTDNLLVSDPERQSMRTITYLQDYSIQQKRRLKSKQINYFDHPLLGILLLITPYQPQVIPQSDEISKDRIPLEQKPQSSMMPE